MIVSAEKLSETPVAFQRYVRDFFKAETVLGMKCYVASTVLNFEWPGRIYPPKLGEGLGTAPSHSVDLRRYDEGLKKDQSLNEWMNKAEGKYLWRFYDHEPSDYCDND